MGSGELFTYLIFQGNILASKVTKRDLGDFFSPCSCTHCTILIMIGKFLKKAISYL